ncbi:MAG: flagellar hook-basal body complex protein FliE [Candidatus Margulisbacteria bacterium]|nr:flagellar hook-basal body complex protein FliE [Candidatus Margulisiibacteriota bacterium]
MAEAIDPVKAEMKLSELLGDNDFLAQAPSAVSGPVPGNEFAAAKTDFTGNPFEDMLSKAIESLNGVSRSEVYANQMIDGYLKGQVELQDVMVAQSKASLMAQLAMTTVNTAVTTFKEITQMQI